MFEINVGGSDLQQQAATSLQDAVWSQRALEFSFLPKKDQRRGE